MTENDRQPMPQANQRGWAPVPDPTVLTTEALQREIKGLGELLRAELVTLKVSLDSFERLCEVRYQTTQEQFAAIEAWRKEQKLDTKTAVDAALQAAEKAVREQTVASEKAITKSETSATEQSKQQYATFTASLNGVTNTVDDLKLRLVLLESMKGLPVVVDDLKARVGTIEAVKLGGQEIKSGAQMNLGMVISIIAIVFVILGFFLNQAP